MRAGKWSVSPFALVMLAIFIAAVAATVLGSGTLAKVGIGVAILMAVFGAIGAAAGPSITKRPGMGLASRGRGDVPGSGRGVPFDPGGDDGSDAQYIAKAGTPSDEAWQRERALYEDKQAHQGDS